MPLESWVRWPPAEALAQERRSRPRHGHQLDRSAGAAGDRPHGDVRDRPVHRLVRRADGAADSSSPARCSCLLNLATRSHRLWWALALVAAPAGQRGAGARPGGAAAGERHLVCGRGDQPAAAAAGGGAAGLCGGARARTRWPAGTVTWRCWPPWGAWYCSATCSGWTPRRGAAAQRLLEQQLAARAAEAESAALAERARIAREIHDVLAHSLSAQLVHLEAARLMLDRGAEREQIRERVVAARRMAQDGLVETRQALSALRGEFTPVGEFLVELARTQERAVLTVHGTPRPLAAEAGLAVRRTAQEALTNVRKHASGGGVHAAAALPRGRGGAGDPQRQERSRRRCPPSWRPAAAGTVCWGCANARNCSAAACWRARTTEDGACCCGCRRERAEPHQGAGGRRPDGGARGHRDAAGAAARHRGGRRRRGRRGGGPAGRRARARTSS